MQTRVNGQIDAALADLLPDVQRQLDLPPAEIEDLSGLVNTRITGLSVVVTPASVATVVPLPAASAASGKPAAPDPGAYRAAHIGVATDRRGPPLQGA